MARLLCPRLRRPSIQHNTKRNTSITTVTDACSGLAMLRLLRRTTFTAAAGAALYAAVTWEPSEPLLLPRFGSSSSYPSTTAATGHLALVRAHPDLRELNALLTPYDFLVDATQALLASALRRAAPDPATLRKSRDSLSGQILSAEATGNTTQAVLARAKLVVADACDGRLEDALQACSRLTAEGPYATPLRPLAAALCQMLGRPEEGARWLEGCPELFVDKGKDMFINGVLMATRGCGPRDKNLVLITTLGVIEMGMWSMFKDGDLSERLQVLVLMAFLRHVVAKNLGNDAAEGS